jgi:RecA-family ATPase
LNVTSIIIPSAHRTMAGAKPENRQRVFELLARELLGYVRKGQADHADVVDALQAMAEESGLVEDVSQDQVQAIMAGAEDAADILPDVEAPTLEPEAKPNGHAGPAAEVLPLETFDAGDWEGQPIEPRLWVVRDRIPCGEPGIISGDGGTGKTLLGLQACVAVGAERPDFLGAIVETHGPALIFSAEEKLAEMHRRTGRILDHAGLSFAKLRGRLHFVCDPEDPVLATVNRDGLAIPTRTMHRLEKTVEKIKPALVLIENAAEVYPASEIIRSPVSRFMRKILGGLTACSNAPVSLIQHPSVTGLKDGTGRSGSTAWNNAGRWRINFTRVDGEDEADSGVRQMHMIKANYAVDGEKVRVRWANGVFVPVGAASSAERAAAVAPIDDAFLRCLDAVNAQGRSVSAKKSNTYAPAVFEDMPEACGFKSRALTLAMERHLSGGRIKVEPSGPPSKRREILVRTQRTSDAKL